MRTMVADYFRLLCYRFNWNVHAENQIGSTATLVNSWKGRRTLPELIIFFKKWDQLYSVIHTDNTRASPLRYRRRSGSENCHRRRYHHCRHLTDNGY